MLVIVLGILLYIFIYLIYTFIYIGRIAFARSAGRIIGPIIGGYLWDSVGSDTPFIVSSIMEFSLAIFIDLLLVDTNLTLNDETMQ